MATSVTLLVAVLALATVECHCSGTCTGQYSVIAGLPGRDGIQGPPGPKGDTGDMGRDGRDGVQGVPGRTGDKGDRGDLGPPGETGSTGPKGEQGNAGPPGNQGIQGPTGNIGPEGPIGPQGDPGVVTEETILQITANVSSNVLAQLEETIESLNNTLQRFVERVLILEAIHASLNNTDTYTLCNITSADWRRIAYFDTTQGYTCPTGLRTVSNATSGQTACGRTVASGCNSLLFATNGSYTQVCGRVRGYQFGRPEAFEPEGSTVDSDNYADGVSITYGSPSRYHLWTYAAGVSENWENNIYQCPCSTTTYDTNLIPSFLGNDYYCESGLTGQQLERRIVWEDPLWDGQGCTQSQNTCCDRFGWFHRSIPITSTNVEVRICNDHSYETDDTLLDQLEIWVL